MPNRIFKAKAFAAAAKKAGISDQALIDALSEVMKGQADDLGGGVWKKRLNENRHRSIVLAKGRHYWVYQFLFAKKDQSNITKNELSAFRQLAKAYEGLSGEQIQTLVDRKEFVEIDHGKKIQE
jgi:hypothetical protein